MMCLLHDRFEEHRKTSDVSAALEADEAFFAVSVDYNLRSRRRVTSGRILVTDQVSRANSVSDLTCVLLNDNFLLKVTLRVCK